MRGRERERERYIEKKGTGEIPYTNLCCVFLLFFMLLSLSVPLFFVLSMSLLCVYLLSFSIFAFLFFLPSSLFFFFICVPLSQLIRSWSNFCQFFPAQLLISCSAVTHFLAFFSFLCSVTFLTPF